jgi:hypothetical protein
MAQMSHAASLSMEMQDHSSHVQAFRRFRAVSRCPSPGSLSLSVH